MEEPKIRFVAAARSEHECSFCPLPIKKGDGYKWVKLKGRGKVKACSACPIR